MIDFDPTFNVHQDATSDDPDRSSPTLRRAHQFLWSKPLPNGRMFELSTTTRYEYLHHESDLGEFFLSSDAAIATYVGWKSQADLLAQVPRATVDAVESVGWTIGGMMVFPSNKVEGKPTLNMSRGRSAAIADRLDLTLECIRRFYDGDLATPLGPTIARYSDFFALFGDFRGYVEFFLLQDLVRDSGEVGFFLPFESFDQSGVPQDVDQYLAFALASTTFVHARNTRMSAWASKQR